jgi:hypothetical protein
MIEEFESLSAIYPDTFEILDDHQASFTFDSCKRGIVTLLFSLVEYPLKSTILTSWPIEKAGAGMYEEMSDVHHQSIQTSLLQIFNTSDGEPCLFECVEFVKEYLEREFGLKEDVDEEVIRDLPSSPEPSATVIDSEENDAVAIDLPEIFTSTIPITDRKSIFVAHCVRISSVEQVEPLLKKLLENKKVSRASHPHIYAYTVCEDGKTKQDFNDDGESGASGRLAHLLQLLNVQNCLVIVTRWYSYFVFINSGLAASC